MHHRSLRERQPMPRIGNDAHDSRSWWYTERIPQDSFSAIRWRQAAVVIQDNSVFIAGIPFILRLSRARSGSEWERSTMQYGLF